MHRLLFALSLCLACSSHPVGVAGPCGAEGAPLPPCPALVVEKWVCACAVVELDAGSDAAAD
jgi:hypothetical protein